MKEPYIRLKAEGAPCGEPDTITVTAANATDLFTSVGHGLLEGYAVEFTGADLPAGVNANQLYYVIAAGLTADVFAVSATVGGATINFTDDGTGAITCHKYTEHSSVVLWVPGQKLDVDPQAEYEDRNDEIRPKGPVEGYISAYDPKFSLPMRAYPDPLGLFMFAWAGLVTTTAGNGTITDPDGVVIPTGATRHVYGGNAAETGSPPEGVGPGFKTGITPQTLFCDSADDDAAGPWWRTAGITIEEIKLSGDKGALICDVSAKALYHDGVASDPGLTPSLPALTILPWSSTECQLTWGLSGSATTESFDLTFKQPFEQKAAYGNASKYPSLTRLEGRREVTGTIKKSDIDLDDWDALMDAETFAVVAKYETAMVIGATTYKYTMWVDLPKCQYTGMKMGALEGGKARRDMDLDFGAFYDTTALYDSGVKVTIVNGTAAYNTGL